MIPQHQHFLNSAVFNAHLRQGLVNLAMQLFTGSFVTKRHKSD